MNIWVNWKHVFDVKNDNTPNCTFLYIFGPWKGELVRTLSV